MLSHFSAGSGKEIEMDFLWIDRLSPGEAWRVLVWPDSHSKAGPDPVSPLSGSGQHRPVGGNGSVWPEQNRPGRAASEHDKRRLRDAGQIKEVGMVMNRDNVEIAKRSGNRRAYPITAPDNVCNVARALVAQTDAPEPHLRRARTLLQTGCRLEADLAVRTGRQTGKPIAY